MTTRVEAFDAQAKQKQITEQRFLIRKPDSAIEFDSVIYRKTSTPGGDLVIRTVESTKANLL